MAYNEEIAQRVREYLAPIKDQIEEKRMFGGLTFLYNGKMSVGIVKDDLCVRVVSEKFESFLERPAARPMDFTGKAMKDFAYVSQEGFKDEQALAELIELGIEHAKSKLK